jgi:hypothetical protein
MGAPAPKRRARPRKRPRSKREYVVVDHAPEDSEAGNAAAAAWLAEPPTR